MINRVLSARSPIWQILIYGILFIFAFLIELIRQGYLEFTDTFRMVILSSGVLALVIAAAYGFSMYRFNRANPNNKIRYWGLLPPEFKEEDEGLAAITARATRRVYIFHATLLPVFSIAYVYFTPNPLWVIAGLAVLVLGHFITYWVSIWPAWSDSEDE